MEESEKVIGYTDRGAETLITGSDLVWFRPTAGFWEYLEQDPWRRKKFVEIGAGTGHLARLMTERGLDVSAYDLYPRERQEHRVEKADATGNDIEFHHLHCAIVARPCHSDWVHRAVKNLDCGDFLYAGKPENVELDLYDTVHEIVAEDVGEEGEVLVRVFCWRPRAQTWRLIRPQPGQREEWWQYKPGLERYVTDSGVAGFYGDGLEVVLQERLIGHGGQIYYPKSLACRDELDSGWLSPDGEWYGCGYALHDWVAEHVIGTSVGRLETTLSFVRCYGEQQSGEKLWTFGMRNEDQRKRVTPVQAVVLRRKGYRVREGGGLVSNKNF